MDIEKQAARLGMDENEYRELLRLFIRTSLEELGDLKDAVEAGDCQKANRLLHSLKGAAVNMGFSGFAEQSRLLQYQLSVAGAEIMGQILALIRDTRDLERFL